MARKSGPKNPLRWLFVLRESDELTSVTYYIFAVAGGLIGFVVLSIAPEPSLVGGGFLSVQRVL